MKFIKYINYFFYTIIIFLNLGLYIIFYYQSTLINTDENLVVLDDNSSTFFVEIKGEVIFPGVYEVNENSVINDLITLAGGITQDGTTSNINLAKKLASEMSIYIYSKKDLENEKIDNTTCDCSNYIISSCIDENKSVIISSDNNLININTASKEELMTLDGIGEKKAESIIEYRNKNGGFKNTEDLKEVSGISDTIYENIKNYLTT